MVKIINDIDSFKFDGSFLKGMVFGAVVFYGACSLTKISALRKPWALVGSSFLYGLMNQAGANFLERNDKEILEQRKYFYEQRNARYFGEGNENKVKEYIVDVKPTDRPNPYNEGVLKYKLVEVENDD